jgi:hypothetical protein
LFLLHTILALVLQCDRVHWLSVKQYTSYSGVENCIVMVTRNRSNFSSKKDFLGVMYRVFSEPIQTLGDSKAVGK